MSTRKNTSLIFALGGLSLLLVGISGCAAPQTSAPQAEHAQAASGSSVHPRPLEQVWPEARTLLRDKGFDVRDVGKPESFAMDTSWKVENGQRVRYLVHGSKLDDRSCQVQFSRFTMGTQNIGMTTSPRRDWSAEQELLQRFELRKAAEVRDDVQTQAVP